MENVDSIQDVDSTLRIKMWMQLFEHLIPHSITIFLYTIIQVCRWRSEFGVRETNRLRRMESRRSGLHLVPLPHYPRHSGRYPNASTEPLICNLRIPVMKLGSQPKTNFLYREDARDRIRDD